MSVGIVIWFRHREAVFQPVSVRQRDQVLSPVCMPGPVALAAVDAGAVSPALGRLTPLGLLAEPGFTEIESKAKFGFEHPLQSVSSL